jgi:hypothetical protein
MAVRYMQMIVLWSADEIQALIERLGARVRLRVPGVRRRPGDADWVLRLAWVGRPVSKASEIRRI